jgi:hypothetical protein
VEGPIRDVLGNPQAEGEVGRPVGLERRHELDRKLILIIKGDLDMPAAALLEGGDDLCDRFVLLDV